MVSCATERCLLLFGGIEQGCYAKAGVLQIILPEPLKGNSIPVSALSADMNKLMARLPDIVLCVDDGEVPVNSYLLAAPSEFFMTLLFGEMKEGRKIHENESLIASLEETDRILPRVQVERIAVTTLSVVLDYVCSDTLTEKKIETLFSALEASIRFLIPRLTLLIEQSLSRVITDASVVSFLVEASACGAEVLKEDCLKYISRNEVSVKTKYAQSFEVLLNRPELLLNLFRRREL